MKEIDAEELAKNNGDHGSPVYIAHEGSVYDVTESPLWRGGSHMQIHSAGEDLTTAIQAAPHGPENLLRYPRIAQLKSEAKPERAMPALLPRLLARFPVLRRHPHPMTVHFPIVFHISATMFTLLFLITGMGSFETTALNCLGAGLVFTPPAMATGWYTWWLNYLAKPMRPVTIKQRCSILLLVIVIVAFLWRIAVPDILTTFRTSSLIYLILVCSLTPLVTVIGWFGAGLTFPLEKK